MNLKKKEESASFALAHGKSNKPLLGEWYVILLPMTIQELRQRKYVK
jgi:hypothetical protein